jgi:indole-3-glycerol phosphate synthase
VNELEQLVASTRETVARRQERLPLHVLHEQAEARRTAGDERSFAAALKRPGLRLIAEHKRSSPSAGMIREDLAVQDVVLAYERGGAAALSVLTEESRFDGSLADLAAARAASILPILRKDFIVEPYQVVEAFAAGADAILLIVAALEPPALAELHAEGGRLGLDVLVEVHDEQELARAVEVGAELIGINNRDLATLQVDTRRAPELRAGLADGTITVAESGYRTRAQLDELQAAGFDAVLIGEALMRSEDIEAACRELTGTPAARQL